MGRRRKKQKKVVTKKKVFLATKFRCPFCNHDGSVECKMDRKNKTATLKCRICAQGFELSPINYLMQPIDVFCSWIDELEESQRGGAGINADTSEDDDDDLIGTHGRTDILA